jgi:hypothetical protein
MLIRGLGKKQVIRDFIKRSFCSQGDKGLKIASAKLNIRSQESKIVDEIHSKKSSYSNIGLSIESLVDRLIYHQEGHPLNTLARK